MSFVAFFSSFLGKKENEGKVEARATLERARTLGTVAVEAVKGQRGDRYTRAQMMEGGDECILSREKPGIRATSASAEE